MREYGGAYGQTRGTCTTERRWLGKAGDAGPYMEALTNLLSLIRQGGWVMLPLGFCSILAAAIVIERLIWGPSRRSLFPAPFLETVDELLGKGRFEELLGVCRHQQHALARILSTALLFSSRPRSEMLSHVEVAGQKEAARLTRRLGVLGTIAAICPLLGLLGTVFGMITTFEVIQSEGVGNANALAGGIAEALITTAAGLSIAIPSLVFYRAFMHHAKELMAELEQRISLLLERIPSDVRSTEGVQ